MLSSKSQAGTTWSKPVLILPKTYQVTNCSVSGAVWLQLNDPYSSEGKLLSHLSVSYLCGWGKTLIRNREEKKSCTSANLCWPFMCMISTFKLIWVGLVFFYWNIICICWGLDHTHGQLTQTCWHTKVGLLCPNSQISWGFLLFARLLSLL